jgi:ABC-type branched-subunit amino acid transport system ATPase component
MNDALLDLVGVSKHFGGVSAMQDVTLSIGPGRRVGLIGPNGAGKSTVVNTIAGGLKPSSGEVMFEGASIRRLPAQERFRRGVSRTFQNLELFLSMSVLENVVVATEGKAPVGASLRRGHNKAARAQAMHALELLGIEEYADMPAGELPYGVRKLVELSRAFVTRPKLLLLDEPVAGLSDTDEFLSVLGAGLDELGCAVLLVEHDMPTVQRLTEYVYVLETGRLIASGTYAEVSKDPHVIEAYLGRETN